MNLMELIEEQKKLKNEIDGKKRFSEVFEEIRRSSFIPDHIQKECKDLEEKEKELNEEMEGLEEDSPGYEQAMDQLALVWKRREKIESSGEVGQTRGDLNKTLKRLAITQTVSPFDDPSAPSEEVLNLEGFLGKVKEELEKEGGSILERLAIERILLCMTHLWECEKKYILEENEKRKELISRRLDKANRMYLQSLRTLGEMRKLSLRINVNLK